MYSFNAFTNESNMFNRKKISCNDDDGNGDYFDRLKEYLLQICKRVCVS